MSDVLLCINCKHCVHATDEKSSDTYFCQHPDLVMMSPVNGDRIAPPCDVERGTNGNCGPTGGKFEASA